MDYNTQRRKLILPEYGRHIHKMVEWVKKLDSKERRNEQIMAVVSIMGNLNPHLRDINDFKHKLWDHVQIISDFNIDIESPFPTPPAESFQEKPKTIPYSSKPIRIRHYGRNTQLMVEAVAAQEEGELKNLQIVALANHMKKVYLTWNKETVNDEQIFNDIALLSNGAITIDASTLKLHNGYSAHSSNTHSPRPVQKNNGRTNNNGGKSNNNGKIHNHHGRMVKR